MEAEIRGVGQVIASGIGFGVRSLPHLSSHVRVIRFDIAPDARAYRPFEVSEFETDDQSPEDLAAGLDWLRCNAGVFVWLEHTPSLTGVYSKSC